MDEKRQIGHLTLNFSLAGRASSTISCAVDSSFYPKNYISAIASFQMTQSLSYIEMKSETNRKIISELEKL